MTASLFFLVGLLAWTISSFAAGGGSMLLAAAAAILAPSRAVAPIVTVTSLVAALARIALFRRLIVWRLVGWYAPGGIAGAAFGGWVYAELRSDWLQLLVGIFLLSAVAQHQIAELRHWRPTPHLVLVPVSFFSGLVSAVVGASGLLANPFYLGYGLEKQSLLATRAVNSLAIQLTKIASYAAVGALSSERLLDGAAASAGAALAVGLSNSWLRRVPSKWFRQFVLVLLVGTGALMLWQRRALLLGLLPAG